MGSSRLFAHRFRDVDAGIRADCLHALGDWLSLAPGQLLKDSYLKYLGWGLNDKDAGVRLQARIASAARLPLSRGGAAGAGRRGCGQR